MQDLLENPTNSVDVDFNHYIEMQEKKCSAHLIEGIPDYSFSLDLKLRRQLDAIRPLRAVAKAYTAWLIPQAKQYHQLYSIEVGPRQFPEIYAMGEECARRLGIGVPQIFVDRSSEMSAYTMALDDTAPIIVLSPFLIQAMRSEELLSVVGHECGHIHNQHGLWATAVNLMVYPLLNSGLRFISGGSAGMALALFSPLISVVSQLGLQLFLLRWSRCAEISCDRAGLICCGDLKAAQSAFAKLQTLGMSRLQDINIEQFTKQIQESKSSLLRLQELFSTHPLLNRRIEALGLFAECDVFHSWRPEYRPNSIVRSREEIDQMCDEFIKVISDKYSTSQAR